MFPLSASSRVLLEGVTVLALAPLVVEAAMMWRSLRRGVAGSGSAARAARLSATALAAVLAIVFVMPMWHGVDAVDLGDAIRTARPEDEARVLAVALLAIQQHHGREVLPVEVPAALFRSGRFGELQHYYGGLLAQNADVNTWSDLLLLARTARQSGWTRTREIERLLARVDTRPELRAAAAVLASAIDPRTGAAAGALFASGARAATGSTPLAVFEGWSARDAGQGRCDLLVVFTPQAALAGDRVWLHAYPPESHDYVDVPRTFPSAVWKSGELAWEVFHSTVPRGAGLYAGVATGGDLGPAQNLGRVMECGR